MAYSIANQKPSSMLTCHLRERQYSSFCSFDVAVYSTKVLVEDSYNTSKTCYQIGIGIETATQPFTILPSQCIVNDLDNIEASTSKNAGGGFQATRRIPPAILERSKDHDGSQVHFSFFPISGHIPAATVRTKV